MRVRVRVSLGLRLKPPRVEITSTFTALVMASMHSPAMTASTAAPQKSAAARMQDDYDSLAHP